MLLIVSSTAEAPSTNTHPPASLAGSGGGAGLERGLGLAIVGDGVGRVDEPRVDATMVELAGVDASVAGDGAVVLLVHADISRITIPAPTIELGSSGECLIVLRSVDLAIDSRRRLKVLCEVVGRESRSVMPSSLTIAAAAGGSGFSGLYMVPTEPLRRQRH